MLEPVLLNPYRLPGKNSLMLSNDDVASFLNGYTALWHPLVLAAAAALPRIDSSYDHEQPAAGRRPQPTIEHDAQQRPLTKHAPRRQQRVIADQRADADGNLWVRTSQNVDARPVYNVINRKGELIDRVQLPANRVLVGFGTGGVVYLAVRDGATAHLEKARVR